MRGAAGIRGQHCGLIAIRLLYDSRRPCRSYAWDTLGRRKRTTRPLGQPRFCRTATTTADAFCDVSAAMWCGRYDEKLVGAYEVKSAGNSAGARVQGANHVIKWVARSGGGRVVAVAALPSITTTTPPPPHSPSKPRPPAQPDLGRVDRLNSALLPPSTSHSYRRPRCLRAAFEDLLDLSATSIARSTRSSFMHARTAQQSGH